MSSILQLPRNGDTSLELLVAQMKLTRESLLQEIDDISTKELDFSINVRKFETIGTMLFHIADVENSWIFEHLDGQEIDFETWKWAFPLRLELDPIQRTGKTINYYLDVLSGIRTEVLDYLMNFSNTDLKQVFESKLGSTTLEWCLYHINRHEQHHIGQINLLRRLYNEGIV